MEKSIKNDFRGLENLMKIIAQECDWPFAVQPRRAVMRRMEQMLHRCRPRRFN